MQRLFLLTLVCCLTLTALSVLGIAIGRSQPIPDIFSRYRINLCGDKLCFQNIKPGITAWKEALAAPGRDDSDKTPYRIYFPLEGGADVLIFTSDMATIHSIVLRLFRSDNRPTLGTILAIFGPPCGVLTSNGMLMNIDYVELIYPYFAVSSLGFDLNVSISGIASTRGNQCSGAFNLTTGLSYSRWLGIASIDYYKAHTESVPAPTP